jgi:hypothetical protein
MTVCLGGEELAGGTDNGRWHSQWWRCVEAPLPLQVAACCRVRSRGGVEDGIPRVSKISEVENGLNPTIDFQGAAKQPNV